MTRTSTGQQQKAGPLARTSASRYTGPPHASAAPTNASSATTPEQMMSSRTLGTLATLGVFLAMGIFMVVVYLLGQPVTHPGP